MNVLGRVVPVHGGKRLRAEQFRIYGYRKATP